MAEKWVEWKGEAWEFSPMTSTMAERGRTVVPAQIRRQLHLTAGATLKWTVQGDALRVEKLAAPKRTGRLDTVAQWPVKGDVEAPLGWGGWE